MKFLKLASRAFFSVSVALLAACGGSGGGSAGEGQNPGTGSGTNPSGSTAYYLPWTSAAATSMDYYASSSLAGVRSDDVTKVQSIPLPNPAEFQGPLQVECGDVASDGTYSNEQPDYLAYFQSGHWYELSLRLSESQAPFQISAENVAQAICGDELHVTDRAARNSGAILYVLPGPDGNCYTSDDQLRVIQLGSTSAVLPTSLAAIGDPAGHVDFYDTTGKLTGLIEIIGTDLYYVDPTFTTLTLLISATTLPPSIMDSDATQALVLVDGSIYHIASSGTLGSPLYSFGADDVNTSKTSDGTTFFFSDDKNVITSDASSSIYSMPRDGSAKPTEIYSSASGTDATTTAMAVTASNLFFVEAAFSTGGMQTLYVMSKTPATSPLPVALPVTLPGTTTSPTKIDSVASGAINFVALSGTTLYYNIFTSAETDGGGTAKIATDAGRITWQYANSAWSGSGYPGTLRPTDDIYTFDTTVQTLLLAQYGASYSGTVNVQLLSTSTGALTQAGSLTSSGSASQDLDAAFTGGVALGLDQTQSGSADDFDDVFAIDTAKGQVVQTTNTPDADESPVFPELF